ncbi:dihydrolipoyl dehydrogenase 1, mitochondrial [Trichonephila clavata]|uniref:Dihydrolipoyl dehydrogenase n=1 Tax=Trichonephila clavata TaxID=2740835 RepID=A0A8X6LYE0_TRICU|nr:dihydrolipoyl dehydrogenase 1, mitochondrial [Trichonephila clavata]
MASERISLVDKKLSQGYVAPVLTEDSVILSDKHGALYSFDIDNSKAMNWKLHLSHRKKISNMSLLRHRGNVFFIVDNVLHTIDAKTGEIQWEKELRAPVRGKAAVINNKLVVLTIDNYLYVFDIKDGSFVWTYQNGINEVRGLYSISPAISNDKIIAPFSNGELIAFNEDGKKLWSQKLATNLLDTQLTDVTTTPRVLGDTLIATNNSYIYSIDVKSGNILWSKSLQVKSVSDIESYYSPLIPPKEQKEGGRIFIVTKDDKIIGLDIKNGEIVWASDLIENTQLFAPIVHAHTLWVTSNKGSMLAFPGSESAGKVVKVPGGGPGGYKCAIAAAKLGLKVACIDKNSIFGGTCLRVGCIPSKALLHSSYQYAHTKNNLSKLGIKIKDASFDLKEMLGYKDARVQELGKGIEYLFNLYKITKINGLASFDQGNLEVSVEGKVLKTKNIVIATGSDVISLPGINIDEKSIISSTGALSLTEVPKKLVVIGAGAIGLEMSSVWRRLGSEVTVVEFFDRIAAAMDGELSKSLLSSLQKQGIKFLLSTKVEGIKQSSNSLSVKVCSVKDNQTNTIEADKVLVAAGRKPYTEGLEKIKKDNRGFVQVNNRYETNVKGIFAIGDVIGGAMLAHKAEEEGVAVAEIIAGQSPHVDYEIIPSVIYTHPAVSSIGKAEEELKNAGYKYKIGKCQFAANGRAKITDDAEGFVKVLTCSRADTILGVHIIGAYADTLINEAAVAMAYGAAAEDIYRICHSHPDINEAFRDACIDAFFKK